MKIFTLATLIFLISFANSITIDEASQQETEKAQPLTNGIRATGLQGFPYKIGKNFGNEKVNTLINFINAASTFYRDDYKQNLLYIQKSMEAAYEDAGVFSLLIQGNSTNSRTDTFIFGYDNMASLEAGINMINPTWSYYAYFKNPQEGRDNLELIPPEGRGAGISEAKADDLNKIIKQHDGIVCKCDQMWLFNDLNRYDGQSWNVVCHSSPTTYAYVPSYNSQWLATHPGPCYYLIYVL